MSRAPLRVLVVDDEELAIERLQALFGDVDGAQVVGTALDGIEAADKIAALKPDLVMLDIQMPGKSGLRVVADLTPECLPEVIFVTAFEQYAPDAFEVEAADYLLKPVRFDRLRQAVERARRRREMREASRLMATMPVAAQQPALASIWVQTPRGQVRVPVATIEWIEAAKDYVMLHTETRSYIHRLSMTALEKLLDPQQFLRVHRSAFVRPALVTRIERHGKGLVALILENGVAVQVGSTYARSVLDRLGVDES